MDKIYAIAYLKENLGDDLFLKILLDRYPSYNINVIADNKYLSSFKYKNLVVHSNKTEKVFKRIFKGKFSKNRQLQKSCKTTILIGGSMFIEQEKKYKNPIYRIHTNKPFFVLGSNFGPYYSTKFLGIYHDFFKKTYDVCLRDLYSYNLFKDIKNVRYAPDIVFTLKHRIKKADQNKRVIFSLIDPRKKISKYSEEKYEIYIEKMTELVNYFLKNSYDVVLMSFCDAEGDELVCNLIESKIKKKDGLSKYFYSGDVNEALDVIGTASTVIGGRFHANVLGLLMGKNIIPMSYSNKTDNLLKDINFKGIKININDIKNFNLSTLNETKLNYICNVSKEIKDAELHFEMLDKILERK